MFLYGGFVGTSNNAMELTGALSALRLLNQPCRVTIVSDSKYVVDGLNWMIGWCANGWRRSDGGQIKNVELWKEMFQFSQYHIITGQWVKGHSSNFSNTTCDHLACIAAFHTAGVPVPPHLIDPKRK
jgi:ribonuclease HI